MTSRSIGYIVSTWPRLSQTFVLREILALEQRGLAVRIFSVKDPVDEPIHGDVARVRAPVTYLSFQGQRKACMRANLCLARSLPRRYFLTLLSAAQYGRWGVLRHFFRAAHLADMLRREPLAHIHAHFATAPTLVAMFTKQLIGVSYSFTAHARDIYVDVRPALLRAQIERADAVVTVSEYNRRYLRAHVDPASGNKVHCIYNGVDLQEFEPCSPRTPTAEPILLSIGRLVEKKGFDDLITAVDVLRRRGHRFRVEIIGDGPLAGRLQSRLAALGLEHCVQLRGAQPQDAVRCAYGRAALFALPCVTTGEGDRDGIPTVLLEAMASGIPVVSTGVSGIPELIKSGQNGLLVPAHDPQHLANAIESLLTDPPLRDRLARAARATIQANFSLDRSVSDLLSVFPVSVAR